MQGVAGGSQGVVELVSASGSDNLRDIMGSAGFVLEDIIQDAGLAPQMRLTGASPDRLCRCLLFGVRIV